MQNKCSSCCGCDSKTKKCACGCPLTEENICLNCGSEEVCKYCCGCEDAK